MQKIVSLLLAVVMLLGVAMMAGCNAKSTGANFEVPEGGYDGSAVTITFSHTMGTNLTPVLDQYIAEFNKLYPNITVQYESVGGYDDVRDQISTQITVGNQWYCQLTFPQRLRPTQK